MEGILNQRVCGGVERIVLLPIGELDLTQDGGGWDVELPFSAVEIGVEEGTAQCCEERVVRDGVSRVTHNIEALVEEGHPALQLLADADEGLAAVVSLNSGESRLLGYSSDFAKERPLRVMRMERVSGSCRADDAEYRIRLWSEDNAFAQSVNL